MKAYVNGGLNDGRSVFRVGSIRDVESESLSNGQVTVGDTSTVARVGDIFRAETGALQYIEVPVTSVSTNSFTIATTSLPGVGSTFYLLRKTSSRVDDSGSSVVATTSAGSSVVTTVRNDYSSVNVTTGAWVQLVASLGATVNAIEIFDSSGQTLELGTGAAASETRLILLTPGGNEYIPLAIASGTRVSIRAVSGTANVGELDINFYS